MLILALGVISCSQEDILDPDLMLTDLRDDDPSCELGFVDRELRNDDYASEILLKSKENLMVKIGI